MKFNFSSKLIFIYFLISLGIFLFPTIAKGAGCTFSYPSSPTCGSHYGTIITCCGEDSCSTSLSSRSVCLPWQTAEFKTYCSEGGCVTVFLGCNVISCAKPPVNLRYYDNPSYPTNPFLPEKSIDANNVPLPVKIAWDNVEGWKDGWVDDKARTCFSACRGSVANCTAQCLTRPLEVCLKKCDEIGPVSLLGCGGGGCDQEVAIARREQCGCIPDIWRNNCKNDCPNKIKNGINFYQIRITGELRDPQSSQEITEYKVFTDKPEFIPPSCLLKSSRTYGVQVRGCSSQTEANCGGWSQKWSFTTASRPELVYPLDPDWENPKRAENIPIPIKFDWCSIDNAKSYFLDLYKDGKLYYPIPVEKENNTLNSEINLGTEIITKLSDYDWKITACANGNGTKCGPECTNEQTGQECGDYSQYWKLTTGDIGLPAPKIITPDSSNNLPTVNLSDYLSWETVGLKGVLAYHYEIIKDDGIVFSSSTPGSVISVSFKDLWDKLEFNQLYSWKISSCWDEAGKKCEGTFNTSNFKTTGAPPTNLRIVPTDEKGNIIIPITIKSDAMPGASSYHYEISQNENFSSIVATGTLAASQSPEGQVDYPNLKTKTKYWLKLKTCADTKGKVCGDSSSQIFTTFTFSPISNPKPANGANLLTYEKQLAWDNVLGARYYQYQVSGGLEGIIAATSTYLATEKLSLGNHSWSVRSCLDKNCQEAGEWSNFTFNLVQTEKCPKALVSCGRSCNSPDTPWNDRNPCQFKDIFQLFKNILDFVLWTLVPFILVLLSIYSGVIYYFSMADPNPMIKVKGLWKSFGKGCLIIFGAWFVISWLLLFLGFQVQIFGHWYQSPF